MHSVILEVWLLSQNIFDVVSLMPIRTVAAHVGVLLEWGQTSESGSFQIYHSSLSRL